MLAEHFDVSEKLIDCTELLSLSCSETGEGGELECFHTKSDKM